MLPIDMPAADRRSSGPALSRRALALRIGAGALALPACGTGGRANPARETAATSAAGTPPPGRSPTPAPAGQTPPSDQEAVAGIQDTLNRQAAARAAHDRAAFVATIDQRNLTWRRILNEVFDAEQGSPRGPDTFAVTRVRAKQNGYYKAWIDVTPAGGRSVAWRVVWVFRPSESGWLHTEILDEELGARQTLDTDHFRLSFYAWDDDTVDRTGRVAEQAYADVLSKLGTAPSFRSVASVNPTYGAHSALRGQDTLAVYLPDTKNTIVLRSLESYGAGYVPVAETPEQHLLPAFVHEFTHLVNDQVVPVVKMQAWMSEGLAEYVAQNYRDDEVRSAYRAGTFLALDQAADVIEWWTDPARGYTSAQIRLAYGEAALAVTYFVERFGLETFWDLARTFAESRKWPESFASATGVSWDQYQSDWLAWLRRRLGL